MNSQKTTGRLLSVSAVGAASGVLLALAAVLQFHLGGWNWVLVPLAALVSAAIFSAAYDLPGLARGLSAATRQTAREAVAWRQDFAWWREWVKNFTCLYLANFAFLSTFFVFLLLPAILTASPPIKSASLIVAFFSGTTIILFVLGIMAAILADLSLCPERRIQMRKDHLKCAKNGNPVAVSYWILFGLFWSLRYLVRHRQAITAALGRFARLTIFYVYTSERRICFISVATGSLLGFGYGLVSREAPYLWGTIFGALAGAALAYVQARLVCPAVKEWQAARTVAN